MFPVLGMVLGGAVAGPVGLAAGLKLGSVAAVSGGIIGKCYSCRAATYPQTQNIPVEILFQRHLVGSS